MPLVIKAENGKCVPQVVCDHCGEEITTSREGNVQWRSSTWEAGAAGESYFTHKECCRAFEARELGTRWMWMPLDSLLVYLANNLEVEWDKAKERAALLSHL